MLEEVKRVGSSATAKQALDLFNLRSTLTTRINKHHTSSSHYLDRRVARMSAKVVFNEENDGKPEASPLCLPSYIREELVDSERTKKLIDAEIQLRRAKCLQSLQRLRTTALQKAQMLMSKQANAKGQTQGTRIQGMITRLSDRVNGAISDYNMSRRALAKLSSDAGDNNTFRPLAQADTSGLMTILTAAREPGEGYKQLPWFWMVRPPSDNPELSMQQEEKEGVVLFDLLPLNLLTYSECTVVANRVEWFRARERFRRWDEEVMILRREMGTVLFDFEHRRKTWTDRSQGNHAQFHAGYQSYCVKQAELWLSLHRDALEKFKPYLLVFIHPVAILGCVTNSPHRFSQ